LLGERFFTAFFQIDHFGDVTGANFELGRRELAEVSLQVRFQAVTVGGYIEPAIQQVQQLQHDQADRRVVVAENAVVVEQWLPAFRRDRKDGDRSDRQKGGGRRPVNHHLPAVHGSPTISCAC